MKLTRRQAVAGGAVAAVIAIAAPFTGGWEGLVLRVYPDPATHGAPWTYCYGETSNPQFGHRYTKAECDVQLAKSLGAYDARLRACTSVSLPVKTEAAFLDSAYNLGVGTYCSTFAPLINAGRIKEACDKLLLYIYANRKVFTGLVRRRTAAHELCLEGLADGVPGP